jgi:hypothetical protein
MLRLPREEREITAIEKDEFVGEFPLWKLRYTRSPDGDIDGLSIDNGRVRNLRLVKLRKKVGE